MRYNDHTGEIESHYNVFVLMFDSETDINTRTCYSAGEETNCNLMPDMTVNSTSWITK